MLKSNSYFDLMKAVAGSRLKETEAKAFLAGVDAWETDKTADPPHGKREELIRFVKAVSALGTDPDLVSNADARALFKLLPGSCKKSRLEPILRSTTSGSRLLLCVLVGVACGMLISYFIPREMKPATVNGLQQGSHDLRQALAAKEKELADVKKERIRAARGYDSLTQAYGLLMKGYYLPDGRKKNELAQEANAAVDAAAKLVDGIKPR